MRSPPNSISKPVELLVVIFLGTLPTYGAATYQIESSTMFNGSIMSQSISALGSVGVSTQWVSPNSLLSGSAAAQAQVGAGIFRLNASAVMSAQLSGGRVFGRGDSAITFSDGIVISVAGLTGQPGQATLTLYVPGSTSGGQTAFADWDSLFSVNGNVSGTAFSYSDSAKNGSTIPNDDYINVVFPFIYGNSFNLSIGATAEARADVNSQQTGSAVSAHAEVEYGNSIYFGGIHDLMAGGQPLSSGSFSISGDPGIDYGISYVPEPSTWALLGIGCVAIASRLRRRVR
jgi:hypothetical protein